MNRITIGRRVYDLGKVIMRHITHDEWSEVKFQLAENAGLDEHVVKIDNELFYVMEAALDPKYKTVRFYYRPMTLLFVIPEDKASAPDLSIRSIRGRMGEL